MEFGVFQGASVGPKPWEESEPRRFREDIEMGVIAEEAGFDYFWAPEHHFLEDYSHNSASHLSCLAVGMRTTRIRLATGIFNLCPPINHPIRVAEQIATIDVLTNGRIELGTGRGSGSTEVNGFGVSTEESRSMWEESIRAIPKMWTQDLFSWDGQHFSTPERCVLPKPVQRPHPPLWVTASNPSTVETAGRMGIGVAVFNFAGPEQLKPLVDTYKAAIAQAEPVGEFVYDKIMALSRLMCLEDGDRARREFAKGANDSSPYFSTYFDTIPDNFALHADTARPVSQTVIRQWVSDRKEQMKEARGNPGHGGFFREEDLTPEFLREQGFSVGTPDEITETLKGFEAAGLDQVCLVPRQGFNDPFDQMRESMHLFGEKVIPSFKG